MARTQIPGGQVKDGGIDTADLADAAVTDQKLSTTGVAAGTYNKVTVNAQGRATAGANATTLAGLGILDGALSSHAYVTIGAVSELSAERALTGSARVTVADGGANSTVTLDLGTVGTPGTYRQVTTDAYGRVTAGANPTTLAGYGITDAQPLDATLTALAAYNSNGILVQTAADTFAGRSLAQPAAGLTIANPSGVAGNPTFALANDLAALEGLGATGYAVRTAADTWAQRTLTAASTRIAIANGDGVAGNTTVDVTEANLNLNNLGGTLSIAKGGTNLTALGAANQVLGVNAGATALEYKTVTAGAGVTVTPSAGALTIAATFYDDIDAARVATTANLSLAAPGATIDGVALAAGDRVLVKDQTAPAENGLYVWNGAATPMTRAPDMDANWPNTVPGRQILVREGTINTNFTWRCSAAMAGTFGSTAITWTGDLWGFGKLVFGNSATPARAASGPFGQRGFTFIDSTSYGRIWRWQNVSVGNSSGVEFITGDNEDAANPGNYWWDVSMHVADQEGMRFARRTGSGSPTPKLLLSATGQLTVGDTVLTGGTTGLSFATNVNAGLYVNATTAIRSAVGATADRPTGAQGMFRFNTTLGRSEEFDGTSWLPQGLVLQRVSGTIGTTSGNTAIPYDNTPPTATEGFQVWSQSFTPLSATSTIVIIVSSFYAQNNAGDRYTTGAFFSGTTLLSAQLLGFTTDNNAGQNISTMTVAASGGTATRTYSLRVGTDNSNTTVYFGQGTTGQAYGSATQAGRFIILEIA